MAEPAAGGMRRLGGAWTHYAALAVFGTLAGWTGRGYDDPIPNWIVASFAVIVVGINVGIGLVMAVGIRRSRQSSPTRRRSSA